MKKSEEAAAQSAAIRLLCRNLPVESGKTIRRLCPGAQIGKGLDDKAAQAVCDAVKLGYRHLFENHHNWLNSFLWWNKNGCGYKN